MSKSLAFTACRPHQFHHKKMQGSFANTADNQKTVLHLNDTCANSLLRLSLEAIQPTSNKAATCNAALQKQTQQRECCFNSPSLCAASVPTSQMKALLQPDRMQAFIRCSVSSTCSCCCCCAPSNAIGSTCVTSSSNSVSTSQALSLASLHATSIRAVTSCALAGNCLSRSSPFS